MKCNEFQQWLTEQNLVSRIHDTPEEYRLHKERCGGCNQALQEIEKLAELLQSIRAPDLGDTFWENYLSEVVARVREKHGSAHTSALPLWVKRALIPAAATIILIAGVFMADRYFPILDGILYNDNAYSSTLDFIWEEHEQVLSEYMFDPTPLYTIEDVFAENWEEINKQPKQN